MLYWLAEFVAGREMVELPLVAVRWGTCLLCVVAIALLLATSGWENQAAMVALGWRAHQVKVYGREMRDDAGGWLIS